jgi:hypothetical protein
MEKREGYHQENQETATTVRRRDGQRFLSERHFFRNEIFSFHAARFAEKERDTFALVLCIAATDAIFQLIGCGVFFNSWDSGNAAATSIDDSFSHDNDDNNSTATTENV